MGLAFPDDVPVTFQFEKFNIQQLSKLIASYLGIELPIQHFLRILNIYVLWSIQVNRG